MSDVLKVWDAACADLDWRGSALVPEGDALAAQVRTLRNWSFCPYCGVKAPRPALHRSDDSGECPGAGMQREWAKR